MRSKFGRFVAACIAAVGSGALCGSANAQVVISQASGGGGFGAPAANVDFVELFNRGAVAQDLTGWSVQCSWNTTTAAWFVIPLSGTIQPGAYYLVQCYVPAGATGTVIPAPDAVSSSADTTILFSDQGGVAVLNTTTPMGTGSCLVGDASVIDFLRWGTAGTCFEGGGRAPATASPGYTVFRLNGGCTDTNNNNLDFTTNGNAVPTPRNSASPLGSTNGVFVITSAAPNPANAGGSTLLTASFQGCGGPNPNITGVTADLQAFGLGAAVPFTGGPMSWTYNLSLPSLQATGNYTVNITGTDGTNSYPSTVAFRVIGPPPANDTCAGAIVIGSGATTLPYSTSADNSTATEDAYAVSCNTGSLAAVKFGVWYVYTASALGSLNITETGTQDVIWASFTSPSCPGTGTAATNCLVTDTAQSISVAPGMTYYVLVGQQGSSATAPAVPLALSFFFTPAPANELCGGAIDIFLNKPIASTTAAAGNDYQVASGNPPFSGVGQTSTIAPGRDLVYKFNPSASGNYSIRASYANTSNIVLYVTDACPTGVSPITIANAPGGVIAASNRNTGTANASEEIYCLALNAGTTYYIFVDELALTAGGTFVLEVNKCSGEIEPNGTPATATAYVFGDSGMEGSISTNGDFDFFSLGIPASGSRVFGLVDAIAAGASADSELRITTDTNTLEFDDDGGDGAFGTLSSVCAGTPATGVAMYAKVNAHSATTTSEPYRLYVVVQPGIASAALETEPNDIIAQANSNGINYFSGTTTGATDIDMYSFTVVADQLIYVAVDGDPLRDNTPINPALALLDSAGNVLVSVNDAGNTSSITAGALLTSTTPNSPGEALVWRARVAGTYYARVTAATAGDYLLSIAAYPQVALAACCKNDGICVVSSGVNCTSPSLYQAGSTACGPANSCPTTVSACCNSNTGACVFVNGSFCGDGFAYQGPNSVCNPNNCPTQGSCCKTDGSCTTTNLAGCVSPNLFQGATSTCPTPTSCPNATLACCGNQVNTCTYVSGGSCPAGTSPGSSSVCSPNTCTAPPGIVQPFDSISTGSLPSCWSQSLVVGADPCADANVPTPWATVTSDSHSASKSVFTSDVDTNYSQFLTLPTFTAAGTITLDFWAKYTTESTYDGWVVEVNTNGGGFIYLPSSAWTLNGYIGPISTLHFSDISGLQAFSGTHAWEEHSASITANVGDQITIRFRMVSDESIGSTGVWIDDVVVVNVDTNGTCCTGGSCTYISQSNCSAGGGTWDGSGCTCDSVNCGTPSTVTCCRGATCQVNVPAANCVSNAVVTAQVIAASCTGNTVAGCCFSDFNKNGHTTIDDIFIYLNAWFASSVYADISTNGANAPSIDDIFIFLNAWFTPCSGT